MIGIDIQEELLSIQEAAEILTVPVKTIRTWVRQGRIRPLKFGRRYFYRLEDLLAVLRGLVIEPFIKVGR